MQETTTPIYYGGHYLVYQLLQAKIRQVTEEEEWVKQTKTLSKIIKLLPDNKADDIYAIITRLLDIIAKKVCQETFISIDTFYTIPLPDEMADAIVELDMKTVLLNFKIKPPKQTPTKY